MLQSATTLLELVEYQRPPSRDRVAEIGLDSEGFKTIAVGFRDQQLTGRIFDSVRDAGLEWTVASPANHIGGNHAIGDIALNLKTLSVPHELEQQFGFAPEPERWWRPPAPVAS